MKLLVFLFAVLAVVAMVSANNPMCNDAAQSGSGYKIIPMSGQGNYRSSKNYRPTY